VQSISGSTNRLMIQPHANNLILRSCHNATNVKTTKVERIGRFEPPKGTYKYLQTLLSSARSIDVERSKEEKGFYLMIQRL